MKLKLLFIICLFCTIKSFSQAYQPFQFGNTRWKNAHYDFNSFVKDFCFFSTDTIGITINNLKYYPIEKSNSPVALGGNTVAYLRDDTTAKKVFILNLIDSTENILYDFSVQASDTVKGIKFSGTICGVMPFLDTIKIDSVVIRNYNGINRRLFLGRSIANHPNNMNIYHLQYRYVEGIGSIQDLLDPKPYPWTDPSYYMNCYSYNSINYYGVSSECNMFYTAVNDLKYSNKLSIYPNPSLNGIFNIKTIEKITWQVSNIEGKIILQGNQNKIDISLHPTGIYILQIKTNNNLQTIKLKKL
jgi:hypothetical protein